MNTRLFLSGLSVLLAVGSQHAFAQFRVPQLGAESGLSVAPPADAARPPAAPAGGPRPVDRVVAVVNSEAITELELEQRVRAISRRLRSQGTTLPPESELQRQILERMIVDRAQVQAAAENGIRVDDAAIDRAIGRIAQESKISVAQLRERVESEGTSFGMFRQELGAEMAIGRIREREVEAKIQVSEPEIDAYLAEQASAPGGTAQYNIAQILVRVPEDASPEVVERALRRAQAVEREARAGADFARIAANVSEGVEALAGGVIGLRPADRLPPLFVEAVAPLAIGDVSPVLRSPAGFHVLKLLERREPAGSRIASAPVRQTRARHILVRVNELNPEAEVVRRLTEIRQRLEAGTVEFADMARQYSGDGSAQQGGDLGWVYPGDTVPEFERAMDALALRQIAGPVRTPFGYHLIEVTDRRTDEASPERIRAGARAALRERKVADAYQEWIAQVRDRAYVEYRLEDR
jgi:peptidyl-prolyl cis-trans isomerase SurA